jgi:hypothetical protein
MGAKKGSLVRPCTLPLLGEPADHAGHDEEPEDDNRHEREGPEKVRLLIVQSHRASKVVKAVLPSFGKVPSRLEDLTGPWFVIDEGSRIRTLT